MSAVAVATATTSPRRATRGAFGILFAPVTLLVVFFLAPMVIMLAMSLVKFPPDLSTGFTTSHYASVLTDPFNLKIAWTTMLIGTSAMTFRPASQKQESPTMVRTHDHIMHSPASVRPRRL